MTNFEKVKVDKKLENYWLDKTYEELDKVKAGYGDMDEVIHYYHIALSYEKNPLIKLTGYGCAGFAKSLLGINSIKKMVVKL